jgi:formamidopyrimidine-DNA glycosylase
MIELPEAVVLADQTNQTLSAKCIQHAVAGYSPHKFAWYSGDPASYGKLLDGKTIREAQAFGNHVEIHADGMNLVISTPMHYLDQDEKRPPKHQLLLEFTDGTALSCTVQMWGALMCFPQGGPSGLPDYERAKEKPSPLSAAFDRQYFDKLSAKSDPALSAKAFLATEQRIPGLGNGVLQDILWTAKVHPKRRISELASGDTNNLFNSIKSVLREMSDCGGRDTERDLFGNPGGYVTVLSKNTVGKPCPACGASIKKEAYMGGSIYYCPGCQKI